MWLLALCIYLQTYPGKGVLRVVPKAWARAKHITLPTNLLFKAFPGQQSRPMQLMFSVYNSSERVGACLAHSCMCCGRP
jgi:hypothetical protein